MEKGAKIQPAWRRFHDGVHFCALFVEKIELQWATVDAKMKSNNYVIYMFKNDKRIVNKRQILSYFTISAAADSKFQHAPHLWKADKCVSFQCCCGREHLPGAPHPGRHDKSIGQTSAADCAGKPWMLPPPPLGKSLSFLPKSVFWRSVFRFG